MTDFSPETIRAMGCPLPPVVVMAFGVQTLTEAFAPGRVSVLVPVRRGGAKTTYHDPALSAYLDAGTVVVLAFERRKDARRFEKLLAAEQARTRAPAPTHPAPRKRQ